MMLEYVVGGVAALAVIAGVYTKGRFDGAMGPKQELSKLYAASRAQADHYNEVLRKLRMQHSEMVRQKEAVEREVKRVAAKLNYQRECLDGDGVRVVNDAIAGSAGGTAGAVCKADPVDGWACSDSSSQAGGDSPALE